MPTSSSERPVAQGCISIRGASEHNLRSIDLDIPYYRITTLCGLSGSGKSALAFDVLRAEGQRRVLESFSVKARQYLEKVDKPNAQRIEGIPPAIATSPRPTNVDPRATVGSITETYDYLRLLFSRVGTPRCPSCGRVARRESAAFVWEELRKAFPDRRAMIAFAPAAPEKNENKTEFEDKWREKGFHRGVLSGESFDLDSPDSWTDERYQTLRFLSQASAPQSEEDVFTDIGLRSDARKKKKFFDPKTDDDRSAYDFEEDDEPNASTSAKSSSDDDSSSSEGVDSKNATRTFLLEPDGSVSALTRYLKTRDAVLRQETPVTFFIVSRLALTENARERVVEAVDAAYDAGDSRCWIFVEKTGEKNDERGETYELDGKDWTLVAFSKNMRCANCGTEFPIVEPNLFDPRSKRGKCPMCGGAGELTLLDFNAVFPNPERSIWEGAIEPWNNGTYRKKLLAFLEIADELGVRANVPFKSLEREEIALLLNGSARLNFDGLNGFFAQLLQKKHEMHIRAFLARWQRPYRCPMCEGARLRKEALSVKIGDRNIHDLCSATAVDALKMLDEMEANNEPQGLAKQALERTRARFSYLKDIGLEYLSLDRPIKTLSSGELRRVALTSALVSDLVDMLYILDEPSRGLHPQDAERLVEAMRKLRDRGNTLVAVDHNAAVLNGSDRLVELGPGAGADGGAIVFEGTPEQMRESSSSLTGSYLSGKRAGGSAAPRRRDLSNGFIELVGVSGRNLRDLTALFPLGVLCVVTGPSGAGKSSLVQDALYPALRAKLGGEPNPSGVELPYRDILGADRLDEVALIDQTPIGRSPRSNPVSYLKIFDDIRGLYAETPEAKARGFAAGYFSFNVDGGRCDTCKGEGYVQIDMQFMADSFVKCPMCGGTRYQRPILEATYRNRNIAEVLDMTAREAFGFFRGQPKIQQKLKKLLDVGLDYIRLGQPANSLSEGESQRLKLAARLVSPRKGPCFYILDEPTSGLHFADVVQLLDQLNALVNSGATVLVVDHCPLMMRAADYIIDLGPGAGDKGGKIVAAGTPEEVAQVKESATARYIARALERK